MRSLALVLSLGLLAVGSALSVAKLGCVEMPEPMTWEPRWIDQGLNESEEGSFETPADALLALDAVHMIFTVRNGVYEIHSRHESERVVTRFIRKRGNSGWLYEVIESTGPNPVENQDPTWASTLAEELGAGDDPNDTCKDVKRREPGYECPGDPRISYLRGENLSYPLAYERISQLFDNPRAPDFVIEYQPHIITDIGQLLAGHGHLNVLSSRAVLSFAGPGIKPGRIGRSEETAHIPVPAAVDVAPTIAYLLGIEKRTGIDAAGRLSHDVYLARQDGRVLEEIIDDSGDRPRRAVVISHDALMPTELDWLMEQPDEDLPMYRYFKEEGAWYDYGLISNWPTNTFASLNTIGSGVWSGRHGIIDNAFYVRETGRYKSPITEIIDFSRFVEDDVETLYEAVHRSFPNWHPDGDEEQRIGNFTAALNNPSGRNADLALLDLRETYDWNRCLLPATTEVEVDGEVVEMSFGERYPLPTVDQTIPANAQATDNIAVTQYLELLFGRLPSGERCTPTPRLVFMNLALTDDVAHYRGPHADAQRTAMRQTEKRTEIILRASRDAGIFDETLFVLLSDHGQIMVDHSRLPDPAALLDDLGLKYFANDQFTFVYLYTIAVDIEAEPLVAGREAVIRLTARDDDDDRIRLAEGKGERGFLLPDEPGPGQLEVLGTDIVVPLAHGRAELTLVPEGEELHLRVTHAAYSPRDIHLPVASEG